MVKQGLSWRFTALSASRSATLTFRYFCQVDRWVKCGNGSAVPWLLLRDVWKRIGRRMPFVPDFLILEGGILFTFGFFYLRMERR